MKTFPRRAFTLVEFLLAFTIFAIIASSIYATFFSGIKFNQKAQHIQGLFQDIRWSMETIELDVENMITYSPDAPETLSFSGDEKGFSLILPTDQGLKEIRYYLDSGKDIRVHTVIIGGHKTKNTSVVIKNETAPQTNALIREAQDVGGDQNTKEPQIQVLSNQILENTLEVSYASIDKGKLVWKSEWKEPSFPTGLRINITFIDPMEPAHPLPIQKNIIIPLGQWRKSS